MRLEDFPTCDAVLAQWFGVEPDEMTHFLNGLKTEEQIHAEKKDLDKVTV